MSDFISLCSLSSLPKRFGKRFQLDNVIEIALFQIDGEIHAINNICPHQKYPVLHEGNVEGGCVTCPMHGWKFDIRTGECLEGGNARLKTYEVVVRDGEVLLRKPEPEVPKWME